MELDELKTKWQKSNSPNTITSKQKIMELSQQKSYGPVAALKQTLGRQAAIIPFLIVVLLVQVWKNPGLQTDPFFALFAGIIVLASIFFLLAHVIIQKMSRQDMAVADRLKRQLRSLHQMLLCYRLVSIIGVIMLVIFLEAFKDRGTAQLMQPWYAVDGWLRVLAYLAMLVATFFLSRSKFHKDFGKHLEEIKKSISDAI